MGVAEVVVGPLGLTLVHAHHLLSVFSRLVTTGTFCISFQGG